MSKIFEESLPIPTGHDVSVQGLFYVPDPMLPPEIASTSPLFPVNSTITLESRVPVWTLREDNFEWRMSDLLRGTFVGSVAFQMWLNWSADTFEMHRFQTYPQDVDFNWIPLWIPEEYPLGRPPQRQKVPVLIEGEVQPLIFKLGKLWAECWWNQRDRRQRMLNDIYRQGGFIQLEANRLGIAGIPYLEERWSASRENPVIGQSGRYKLSYYGYTGTNRQDICEIQFCPMDTLITGRQLNPGERVCDAPWVELVMPNGKHMPVETPRKLLENWYQQSRRLITNRLNPGSSAGENFDDNEKIGRKQQRIQLMARWRHDVLVNTETKGVRELLLDPVFVRLLEKLGSQPLLSVNPVDLERVSSSWIHSWMG